MRILIAHNFYQQSGGEDRVFYAEAALLEQHGHAPLRYVLHNKQINDMAYLSVAGKTIWNRQVHRELAELVRSAGIDVVHFHNTFPLISPAAYSAVRKQGAAVVQTLHNYRLLCPSATLFRDGHDCELCLHRKLKLPAVRYRCCRQSMAASAVLAASLAYHRWRGTFERDVDVYISPSEAARKLFIDGGMSADQIMVKPDFLENDPGPGPGGNYALFASQLSHEKGLETLLAAWNQLSPRMPLKIVGDGPMRDDLLEATRHDSNIEWLGRRPLHEIYALLGRAALLVIPSLVREPFGQVAIEAFACGTPVIASDQGALSDIVTDQTGALFAAGDSADLVRAIKELTANPDRLRAMRTQCRLRFETLYTAEQNYQQLIEIYRRAIKIARAKRSVDLGLEFEDNDVPLPHNQLG